MDPDPGGPKTCGSGSKFGTWTLSETEHYFFCVLQDEQLALLVDPVLETEDRNRDGFIDYPEYIAATLKQRIKDKQRAVHHTASWWRHSDDVIWCADDVIQSLWRCRLRHSVLMKLFDANDVIQSLWRCLMQMTSFSPDYVIWCADDVIQFWWRYLVLMTSFSPDDVILDDDVIQSW